MGRAAVWTVAGTAIAAAVALTLLGVGDDPNALPNWQALILGLVQGATELLPISSSGHLILVPWLGDWEYLKEHDAFNQTFDVALHLGTLVAVVAYFWRDLIGLLSRLAADRCERAGSRRPSERVAWFVVVATIPAAIVGFLGEDLIAEHLGEPWQIAILLVVFAGLLWVADRQPERRGAWARLGPREALAIGAAQSLALMPGVSRSGITITAGRFLGLDRDSAARASFLLLVPIVLGAVLLKGVQDVILGELPPGSTGPFVVGTLAASREPGCLRSTGCSATSAATTTRSSSGTGLIAAALVILIILTGARSAGF